MSDSSRMTGLFGIQTGRFGIQMSLLQNKFSTGTVIMINLLCIIGLIYDC